jgi:hypothetical protein
MDGRSLQVLRVYHVIVIYYAYLAVSLSSSIGVSLLSGRARTGPHDARNRRPNLERTESLKVNP